MPKPSSHILELAKRGAEHRYRELKAELATLAKLFPHLGAAVSPSVPDSTPESHRARRQKRRMSATNRKAVSERMRKYWAERRAKVGEERKPDTVMKSKPAKAKRGRRRMSPEARKAVAQRMKKYWAERRKAKKGGRKRAA